MECFLFSKHYEIRGYKSEVYELKMRPLSRIFIKLVEVVSEEK